MPKRPLEGWWSTLFPGTPSQVPRRSFRGGSETPSSGRGYVHPADSPIASPRPTRIGRASGSNVTITDARPIRWRDPGPGRWLSFGRVYRTTPPSRGTSAMSTPREWDRGDSAGAFSTPESTMAPTESQGSYSRMQAFEIESPLAVPESTGWAFSTAFVQFVAVGVFFHFYNKFVPRGRDPADWNRRIMDWIDKYILHKPQAAPSRTVITGTSQPKAHCLPGFPNTFTTVGPSPIAAS